MRTINARMIEEVLRVATVPLDFEQDREIVEEVYYEAVDPEDIESLMEFDGPDKLLEKGDLARTMQDLLDSLTPREKKTLSLRFGIGVDKEYTLEEVAKVFEVSRERIRQIEFKALRKMRHPSRSNRIKAYVDWEAPDDPPPNIKHYHGTMEGLVYYYDALAVWNERQKAAKMKLEESKAKLKKGTLT